MRHRDDGVSLLVSGVDLPVRLGNVLQRVASVDHRFELSRLTQLLEEHHVLVPLATPRMTVLLLVIDVHSPRMTGAAGLNERPEIS
jgi:hypothetical protein